MDVQRDLARRMGSQKWPAVAPDALTLEGGMDVPALGGNVWAEARVRGQWLLGLLALQSMSSIVLEANQELVREHLVITLFLTMLVGAGGNAGNQSAIHVIRGLATGQFQPTRASLEATVVQQLKVGALLGTALAAGGFLRVYITDGNSLDATAISISLFVIVSLSILTGTCLPFFLAWSNVDPAHAGTTIQVFMDVSGVAVTCVVCRLLLTHYATIDAVVMTTAAAAGAAGGL